MPRAKAAPFLSAAPAAVAATAAAVPSAAAAAHRATAAPPPPSNGSCQRRYGEGDRHSERQGHPLFRKRVTISSSLRNSHRATWQSSTVVNLTPSPVSSKTPAWTGMLVSGLTTAASTLRKCNTNAPATLGTVGAIHDPSFPRKLPWGAWHTSRTQPQQPAAEGTKRKAAAQEVKPRMLAAPATATFTFADNPATWLTPEDYCFLLNSGAAYSRPRYKRSHKRRHPALAARSASPPCPV